MTWRVDHVECDGFLMEQSDLELYGQSLLTDTFSDGLVVDGVNLEWRLAGLRGNVKRGNEVLMNQVQC